MKFACKSVKGVHWKLTWSLLTVLVLVLPVERAGAQALSPACNANCDSILENCALLDAPCHARNVARAPQVAECNVRQGDCVAKLQLYKTYMGQVGSGVTLQSLPALYRDVLSSSYPNVNLANVQIGFSDRQASAAVADCSRIYIRDSSRVDRIVNGTASSSGDLNLLFHELRHAEQCAEAGGRDFYATRWFRELGLTFIQNADIATLHDRMPMEGNADSRATQVQSTVAGCCQAANGRLVRPLGVSSLAANRNSPLSTADGRETVVWTATATGGSSAREFQFATRLGGGFVVARDFSTSNSFDWATPGPGTYQIRVRVQEPGTSMTVAERTASFEVRLVPPTLTSFTLSPLLIQPGTNATGSLQLNVPAPAAGFPVNVSSSNTSVATTPTSVNFPADTSTASFTVTGASSGCCLIDAAGQKQPLGVRAASSANFELSVSSVTATSAQGKVTVPFMVTLANPVTFQLTSSNPAMATVPSSVTFGAGNSKTFAISFGPVINQCAVITVTLGTGSKSVMIFSTLPNPENGRVITVAQ